MHTLAFSSHTWSTASKGKATDTSPGDLSALGEHLGSCQAMHGRLFALHCVADTMHGFVAARFVTTLVVLALLVGLSTLLF
jgi:hypothetical protein